MAVSYLCGFEMGSPSEAMATVGAGTTVQSVDVRSGNFALRLNPSAAASGLLFSSRAAGGTFRSIFRSVRFYLRIVTLPSAATTLARLGTTATGGLTTNTPLVMLNPNGSLLINTNGQSSVTTIPTLSADGLWHRIELDVGYTGGAGIRLFVDGAEWANAPTRVIPTSFTYATIGSYVETWTGHLLFDDIAWYDSALPATLDAYNLDMLLPMNEPTIGGWRRQNGTGNLGLAQAVDNQPPVGSTGVNALQASRVENIVASATDNLELRCEPYRTLGGKYARLNDSTETHSVTSAWGNTAAQTELAFHFTVPAGMDRLEYVNFWLAKAGTPTDRIHVTLHADSGVSGANNPGTLIDTSTIFFTGANLVASQAIGWSALFENAVVTPGQVVWIRFYRATAINATNYYQFMIQSASSTPDVGFKKYDGSTLTWGPLLAGEPEFRAKFYSTQGTKTVRAVQTVAAHAQEVTTGSPKAGALAVKAVEGNAATADQNFDFGLPHSATGATAAAAMGTYPVGWGTAVGAVVEDPYTVGANNPIAVVGKRVAVTREVDVAFAGVYAMWDTSTPPAPPSAKERVAVLPGNTAVMRAVM